MAIAESKPDGLAGLGQVSGVGKGKLERYGEAVLAILAGETVE
jgi:DNA helicase-2/ATP-dependent DNA helicase PcrA